MGRDVLLPLSSFARSNGIRKGTAGLQIPALRRIGILPDGSGWFSTAKPGGEVNEDREGARRL